MTSSRHQPKKAVSDISDIRLVTNCEKLTAYIERNQTKYSRKMMRIKHYHVVEKTAEELIQIINTVPDGREYLISVTDRFI